MEMIVLDTCILIEVLKGNEKIVKKILSLDKQLVISSISAMELYYGALNKQEQVMLEKFIAKFKTIQITTEISKLSINLIKKYSKSHSLDIPDSLIAATCIANRYKLCTLNVKDFKFIDKLELV